MNRLKKAWRVLWGEDLGTGYPCRLVSLTYYQDKLVGLSGTGDIYWIHPEFNGNLIVELAMQNPVRP